MWERRKEDVTVKPPPSAPPAAQQPAGYAQPAQRFEATPARTGATIGKSVTIKGEIYSEEDLYLDGEVEGVLELAGHKLTIGPNGKVASNVRAREVIIQGTIRGNVEAQQKITIRKEGSLVGDIKTAGIIIEDDAYFKGSIDIVKVAEAAKTAG
jgi:cytoskeletal protein CcmA (bactofilin family)